ncbi:MAG TPA: glucosaminidase domain-containing protein [Bryobacteraceae bacterium]|nr:glucosaminidase domain-containing protein [Bryobacteraceae bacterium]
MPLSQTQLAALTAAAMAAVACEKADGLPAELTVPQWADESGWGVHQPENNWAGIKAHAGVAGYQLLPSTEWFSDADLAAFLKADSRRTAVLRAPEQQNGERKLYDVKDAFASYPVLGDCFADHSRIIVADKPYAPAWAQFQKDKKISPFIERIAKSYATDPMYALKLKKILAMPEVSMPSGTPGARSSRSPPPHR